ncbi:hypothetical protein F5887DRAFT_1074595 [Amanita rubescens]|nr:hypothetical protein F5887DRAFT_1074595 [Amanita rubescens]
MDPRRHGPTPPPPPPHLPIPYVCRCSLTPGAQRVAGHKEYRSADSNSNPFGGIRNEEGMRKDNDDISGVVSNGRVCFVLDRLGSSGAGATDARHRIIPADSVLQHLVRRMAASA